MLTRNDLLIKTLKNNRRKDHCQIQSSKAFTAFKFWKIIIVVFYHFIIGELMGKGVANADCSIETSFVVANHRPYYHTFYCPDHIQRQPSSSSSPSKPPLTLSLNPQFFNFNCTLYPAGIINVRWTRNDLVTGCHPPIATKKQARHGLEDANKQLMPTSSSIDFNFTQYALYQWVTFCTLPGNKEYIYMHWKPICAGSPADFIPSSTGTKTKRRFRRQDKTFKMISEAEKQRNGNATDILEIQCSENDNCNHVGRQCEDRRHIFLRRRFMYISSRIDITLLPYIVTLYTAFIIFNIIAAILSTPCFQVSQ